MLKSCGDHAGLDPKELISGFLKGLMPSSTSDEKKIVILSIDSSTTPELLHYLHKYWMITGVPASTKDLKKMHESIEGEKNKVVNTKYNWLILGGSQKNTEQSGQDEKKIQNCLKWATDKMKECLGITLSINLYRTTTVIKKLGMAPKDLGCILPVSSNVSTFIFPKKQKEPEQCNVM